MRVLLHIAIIIAIGLLFRAVYISRYPCIHVTYDSLGYVDIGKNIFIEPTVKNIINPYRTPLYPVFINSVMSATRSFGAQITIPDCSQSIKTLAGIQTIFNLAGLVIFYLLAMAMLKKRTIALIATILQATAINIVAWERSLHTEAIAIPLSILIAYAAIRAFFSPTWKRLLSVCLLSIIGILLRPSFILYPAIIFLFIVIRHKTIQVFVKTLVASGIFLIFCLGFSHMNNINWGYWGIQHVSDINVLSRVLAFHLPLSFTMNVHPLYEYAVAWEKTTPDGYVFTFISQYNVDVFSAAGLRTLREFNTREIMGSPFSYAARAVADIPGSLLILDESTVTRPDGSPILLVSYYLLLIYQYIFIAAIPIWLFAWSKNTLPIQLIGALAFGQVILAVFVGDGMSYGRFYSSIQPLLFLYCAYWLASLIFSSKTPLNLLSLLRGKIRAWYKIVAR